MSDIQSICILGMRRTGSNHLFNVLRNFDTLASCGELFSDARVSGVANFLPQIRELTGLACQSEEDPCLMAYARGNPRAFLNVLEAAAALNGRRAYCFKIFEDQLEQRIIESDVLGRPRTHMVLLMRRSIDTYISLQKALLTDRWMSFDTTGVPITLEAEAFAVWLERQRNWYRHWLEWARQRGRSPVILTYEKDVDRPLRLVLWRFARTARSFNVKLTQPLIIRNYGLHRQDGHAAVASRVQNWPEFTGALSRLGLEKDALGYPI